MIEVVLSKDSRPLWIDVVDPSRQELEQLASTYGLHATSVQDCLEPEHLPKAEAFQEVLFMIVRSFDSESPMFADTVQALTRKVAIFYHAHWILTVHRRDQEFIKELRTHWSSKTKLSETGVARGVLHDLLRGAFKSFEAPIQAAQIELERYETRVFQSEASASLIEDGYILKRRASIYKRVMHLTMDLFSQISLNEKRSTYLQDVQELAQRIYFYAEELMENTNSLLNLYVALSSQKTNISSHRTNEVMRVLTVFSVFFMPLTFICSIYGMNFKMMPELDWQWGYPFVIGIMLLLSLLIFLWFRRKGLIGASSQGDGMMRK